MEFLGQDAERMWMTWHLYTIQEDHITLAHCRLNDFVEWSKESKLKLNPSKCQAPGLQVCSSKAKLQIRDLIIGTEPLSYVTEAQVLGEFLQNILK